MWLQSNAQNLKASFVAVTCSKYIFPENMEGMFIETNLRNILVSPKTFKYWVGAQWSQSYLVGRKRLFSLGWLPF